MKLKLTFSLLMILLGSYAKAQTISSSMDVVATVEPICTISAPNITFPAYTPSLISTIVNVTFLITPTCTKDTTFSLTLNGGMGGGAERKMTHTSVSSQKLVYDLYHTVSGRNGTTYTQIDSFFSSASLVGDGFGGTPGDIPLTARLDTSQNVYAGAYSDTLTLTVTY